VIVAAAQRVEHAIGDSPVRRPAQGAQPLHDGSQRLGGRVHPRVAGRLLRFDSGGRGVFVDAQTSSRWDLTGRAVSGPLEDRRLRPLRHDQQFWFAVAAFLPDGRILR
jgi:hypothetical protein